MLATPLTFAQPATGQPDGVAVLGWTLGLLVAACAALWYARRRGLLARWTGAEVLRPAASLRVVQRLRLGMHSHAYVLQEGDERWMVLEGRQGIQVTPLPVRREGEAP